MNTVKRLNKEASGILLQLKQMIMQLEQQDYNLKLEIIEGNTVGMHVRHILEFYKSLYQGYKNGSIDYDARERNMALETSNEAAIAEIDSIINWMNELEDDCALNVLYQSQLDLILTSSLSRELGYNLEHSIHHMAILKICMNTSFPNIKLDQNFGVSHATIQYRASTNVHSKLSA